MSRSKNSYRNIQFEFIGQVFTIGISFVTRTVFIQVLSAEYLGLNGLFSNILSALSFAELGIGTAITYSLYKPIAENDYDKIKAFMAIYKKAYMIIGLFILITGMALTPFLDFLIKGKHGIEHLELFYIMYVIDSGASYFFSYKRSFLIANQKKHMESKYYYSFKFIASVFQIIFLLTTKKFIVFLFIQIVNTFITNLVLNMKINKMYPFLTDNDGNKITEDEKRVIIRNTKAGIIHKVGSIIVLGTDNILISKFSGLITVGLYSNYLLIISALDRVFSLISTSLTASVGNLGATDDKERSIFIFHCIDLLIHWMVSFSSISLFVLINPFISLWLGSKYVLSDYTVFFIIVNFYLKGRRKNNLIHRDSLGLMWYDKYKAVFESIINLAVSIILASQFGINGVLLGTIISTVSTCTWVEPYIVYKYGFHKNVFPYFVSFIYGVFLTVFAGFITLKATAMASAACGVNNYFEFIIKMIVVAIVPNLIFYLCYRRNKEFKYLVTTFKTVVLKKT